jgi:membrane-bound metal-dependent hydrolase YbcI (DUF457 family)
MEPITHALASVALARTAFPGTRLAAPMAIAASLAVDTDWLSVAAGAETYWAVHRAATHSAVGAAVVTAAVASAFWWIARKRSAAPLAWAAAMQVALAAVALHLLLDLMNPQGVALVWPFDARRFAWDLLAPLDPWLLAVLLAGWLVPALLGLVTEEIGARKERRGGQGWAAATLVLLALYCGGRALAHGNAVAQLGSRVYHGAAPVHVTALPDAASPLRWHGLVETERTIEELTVTLGPGALFDPDRSRTQYKPESSDALTAALGTDAVQRFVRVARVPLARVERLTVADGFPAGGYRVTVRDLRFGAPSALDRPVVIVVELDAQFRVLDERLEFEKRD